MAHTLPQGAQMSDTHPVTMLLVEDDPGHARLIERNLRRSLIVNDIITLSDGQAAVDYLFGEGCKHPMPLLILLDLHLPVLDGFQVLARLKADERTKHIPVICLTTVDDPRDIARCYALGCNVYITKPVDYAHFAEGIHQLGLFLSIVKVPRGEVTL
jgi:CheY-like chemotaxis protein